jgi:E3 ubiquitin-protein ligase synoviolin
MLGALDLNFVCHAYQSTITKGASVQLVFGFEYAILLTVFTNIAIKYSVHTVDLNSENPWENKAVFLLYSELVMGES